MISGTVKPSVVSNLQSDLYRALFRDVVRSFPKKFLELDMDFSYLLSRIENEGEKFCLTVLPLLGKAIETSLITQEPLQVPSGWRLVKGTKLPMFLNALLKELFSDSGYPLWSITNRPMDDMPAHAVQCVRQVTMLWSKVSTEADEEIRVKAVKAFAERITKNWEPSFSEDQNMMIRRARALLERVFNSDLPEVLLLRRFRKDPWGRHGPGAVAGRETGREKWNFHTWPGYEQRMFTWAAGKDLPFKEIASQPHARVVDVPKDFRGPRIICVEPKENQFAQQGMMDIIYRLVHVHPLTRRSISFTDVSPSREMCYSYNLSTIDLKDASDNISVRLARLLLPGWVFRLVTRYRTRKVDVDGNTVTSTSLATMGNATCFPLETLIFWALSRSAIDYIRKTWPFDQRQNLPRTLRVFGDDIICPLWATDVICELLEACGMVVNSQKTCTFTLVRESCGEWVYNGRTVRIVRPRSATVSNYRSWLQWLDYVSEYRDVFPALSVAMRDHANKFLDVERLKRRFNPNYQRMEIRVPQIVISGACPELADYQALYAWHVGNDLTPFLRGARELVKWRWIPDYVLSDVRDFP